MMTGTWRVRGLALMRRHAPLGLIERLLPVDRARHRVALRDEHPLDELPDLRLVVHDEDERRGTLARWRRQLRRVDLDDDLCVRDELALDRRAGDGARDDRLEVRRPDSCGAPDPDARAARPRLVRLADGVEERAPD